jgi:MFS family permease
MTSPATPETTASWWRLLNRYQWFVFVFAAMGWLFDTMDQQLFIASRSLSMMTLLPGEPFAIQTRFGSYATSLFILGWASGGLLFGIMGDKWGRVKTMALTILIYSVFTGLSGLAPNFWTFALGRFLTGFGVGGEFAVGAALVAEVMPPAARPKALGMLQALSAVGNIMGAKLLGWVVPHWGWRGLYYLGAAPAIIGLIIFWRLQEPERFLAAKAAARGAGADRKPLEFGKISDLFMPRWRRNTLVGLALAIAGVLGLWGAAFYSPELIDSTLPTVAPGTRAEVQRVLAAEPSAQAGVIATLADADKAKFRELRQRSRIPGDELPAEEVLASPLLGEERTRLQTLLDKSMTENEKTQLKSQALVIMQIGAFFGIYSFGLLASRIGRKRTFLLALVLGWAAIVLTFGTFQHAGQIWYLWPLLGFGTLAVFGGYAIYFPELFPTRLRSTGTGFCYNVGRYIAAIGPLTLGQLALALHGSLHMPGFRLAALVVGSAYLLGAIALIWAPETLNEPLPED